MYVIEGWVPLKVVCSFPKVKKLSKDARAIAAALEGSAMLVVRPSRVRRKVRGRLKVLFYLFFLFVLSFFSLVVRSFVRSFVCLFVT